MEKMVLGTSEGTKSLYEAPIEPTKEQKEILNELGYYWGERIPVQDMLDRQLKATQD